MTQAGGGGQSEQRPPPQWAGIAVTATLLAITLILVLTDRLPTVVGTIIGLVAAYWLPTRPNHESNNQ